MKLHKFKQSFFGMIIISIISAFTYDLIKDYSNKKQSVTDVVTFLNSTIVIPSWFLFLLVVIILLLLWITLLLILTNYKKTNKAHSVIDEGIKKKTIIKNKKTINFFDEIYTSLKNKDHKQAEKIYNKYQALENNKVSLNKNKAYYLYLQYNVGKEHSALVKLKEMISSNIDEESKYEALELLSECLQDSHQLNEDLELWMMQKETFKTSVLNNRVITNLSLSLCRNDKAHDAKVVLLEKLKSTEDAKQLSDIFRSLSIVEDKIGNKRMSLYCLDKSLETDPRNLAWLFDTAYKADNNYGFKDISISNYVALINLDQNQSMALNNLGVLAQSQKLYIKAVEKYQKSASLSESLAIVNQGFLYLKSGFSNEAKKLADSVINTEDHHENVYNLLSEIDKEKKNNNEKWFAIEDNCKERQRFIRLYTSAFYNNEAYSINGTWLTESGKAITYTFENNKLVVRWKIGSSRISIVGTVNNNSFLGQYSKSYSDDNSFSHLNKDDNYTCLGILSENEIIFLIGDYLNSNYVKISKS